MKRARTIPRYGILLLTGALIVVAIGALWRHNRPDADHQKLQVVAAENFWGNIASQIGGDRVAVTSIISDPSTDPHQYESDAHNALALANADVVIENGVDYDSFIDKLLEASPNSQRQVLNAAKVFNVAGDNPNPHLWYDLPRIPLMAQAIEQALAVKDPAHTTTYQANLATFNGSLKPITDVIGQLKTKYPGAPVAYTERVAGYLLADAGLSVKTPTGFAGAIEEGNDPSPSDTATMESLMTNHAIRVLLYNAQATSPVTQHIRDLAEQAGIPVIGVTETQPPSEPSYQSWQLDQAKALLQALGG